jgi:anaerobic selenocysteine-containing dehydrogenase
VQGIGSVGVTPKLKDAIFDRLQNHFGVRLPTTPGRDTMECIVGADNGELKVGFCLGGNLYGSNPDAKFAAKALGNLDQIVYLNTTLNTGHAHGLARETIILPVSARDEEPQPTTQESMFNYVRMSDGGPQRHAGTRSEVEVIASIAENVLVKAEGGGGKAEGQDNLLTGNGHPYSPFPLPPSPLDWSSMRSTTQIRYAIAQIVPGFGQIESIDKTKQEFQIAGRTFHEPRFATPDSRARLHTHELPDLQGTADGEIRLMTLRSEGQFNTVVYEDEDVYRGIDRRDVILLHPDDLGRLGLKDGACVTIHGPAGSMRGIRATAFDTIKPGNAAMYYPECNVLISRELDPQSKTPAFKCVIVRVETPTEKQPLQSALQIVDVGAH